MKVIRHAKLDIAIDVAAVQHQLVLMNTYAWLPHFNQHDYTGTWEGLALRAPGGSEKNIIPDLAGNIDYCNTSLMDQFPAIAALTQSLRCPVMSVRLLNLHVGGVIRQHTDRELAFEKGEARIHFPILTNKGVEFYIDDELVQMHEGESYYLNANRPHRVFNGGSTNRIHLVIDCRVNDWLTALMNKAEQWFAEEVEDKAAVLRIVEELKRQNTPTANELAHQLLNNSTA